MIKLKQLLENDDYNPEWDYDIHKNPNSKIVKLVDSIVKDLKKLTNFLKLGNIRVAYIKDNNEDAIARYINGTYLNPYIVLNIDVLSKLSSNIGRDLEMTIVHELIHAYLESKGLDTTEHDEDVVEGATIEYMDFRDPMDIINYLNNSYPNLD